MVYSKPGGADDLIDSVQSGFPFLLNDEIVLTLVGFASDNPIRADVVFGDET